MNEFAIFNRVSGHGFVYEFMEPLHLYHKMVDGEPVIYNDDLGIYEKGIASPPEYFNKLVLDLVEAAFNGGLENKSITDIILKKTLMLTDEQHKKFMEEMIGGVTDENSEDTDI